MSEVVCSEQENAYHGDSRSGVPRAGHCASAVPSLGHQVGAMRAPASIMPLAALFLSFLAFPARSSPWPLEALRWVVGGETMTTPGGAGTLCKRTDNFLRARRIGFYHGAGALTSGPSLCPAPMP
jgi:hypothetical protein